MEYKDFTARTVDEAITLACLDLGVTSDRLEYDVVQEASGGFLGIGARPAIIKARARTEEELERERRAIEEAEQADRESVVTQALNADKEAVSKAVTAEAVAASGYETLEAAEADGVAFVFMGHGTSHTAKVSYSQMQTQMGILGFENVFVGTVEGEPEETSCEAVIEAVKAAGYTKVILRPLMVVAGDHANNDMAGEDEDSWVSMFTASGAFETIDCQIAGLGRIPAVQELYAAHSADVIGK